MKQTKRKSFVVYTSWRDCFELLDEAEKAQMLMNLFDYHEGNEPTLNTKSLQIAWSVIKPLLKLNTDKYANQVERAMTNVKKRKADIDTTSSDIDTTSSDIDTTSLRPRVANVDVDVDADVDVDVDADADGDVIDDAEANVVVNVDISFREYTRLPNFKQKAYYKIISQLDELTANQRTILQTYKQQYAK